jgi:DNA processing protein
VRRFIALNDRLVGLAFDRSSIPFDGWDKFKRRTFRYNSSHIAPPQRLFVRGSDWKVLNASVLVAFGGTVSPTADGFQLAELLAQHAVDNGAVVVAGGVIGVDMAAHLGALDRGGHTVAVLAKPVMGGLHPYEPKRSFLEDGILQNEGLLVSEYHVPSEDRKESEERLLQRDRVITALSDLFLAVECSKNSATVDAAKRARLQGKKVFVIDWSRIDRKWHKPKTSGTLQLMEENVAEAIPSMQVSDIRSPVISKELVALIKAAP